MALISFANLGAKGLVSDLAPSELPLDAWSSAKNVRFTPLGVEKVQGNTAIYGTPTVEPLSAFPVEAAGTSTWIYGSDKKLYIIDGTTHYNVTRQTLGVDVDYSASATTKWTGGHFNGIVIANNPNDVPQSWIPGTVSTKATDLANWPGTLKCHVMRPYKNFLVAMDLTSSGTRTQTGLRWGHPAAAGSVPSSWDITDATKDAGEWYLNETSGAIVDLVSLRDDGIIYKTDGIWRMQFIGGQYIFRFTKIATGVGMPSSRCAVEFSPGQHFVWIGDDVVVFDGQSFSSIMTSRVQGVLGTIPTSSYQSVFAVCNTAKKEVWLCWPADGANPNRVRKALIWNWITGAWGVKDLSYLNFIVPGFVDPTTTGTNTWASDTNTWDSDTSSWDESVATPVATRLLAGTASQLLYENSGNQMLGVDYESYVERVAFGIPFEQDRPPDISAWKFCREVWPRISGKAGTQIEVTMGFMTEINGAITWDAPQMFTIGTDVKVNCTLSGRMYGIRFRSTGPGDWTLHGYDLEVDYAGGY